MWQLDILVLAFSHPDIDIVTICFWYHSHYPSMLILTIQPCFCRLGVQYDSYFDFVTEISIKTPTGPIQSHIYELHARFVFPDSKTTTEPRTFWAAGRNWCQEGSVLGGCYQCNPLVTSFHSLEIRYLQLPLHMCQPTSCPLSRHAQDVYWNRMQSSQVSPKHCKKRCSGVFFFLDSMSGEMSSQECISFDCRM